LSTVDVFLDLKFKDGDCDVNPLCQNILGADTKNLKKETVELAPLGSAVVFAAAAEDKTLYVSSDSDFQMNINTLGNMTIKRFTFGTKFKQAFHLSRLSLSGLTITNPSTTATIKVTYAIG